MQRAWALRWNLLGTIQKEAGGQREGSGIGKGRLAGEAARGIGSWSLRGCWAAPDRLSSQEVKAWRVQCQDPNTYHKRHLGCLVGEKPCGAKMQAESVESQARWRKEAESEGARG